MSIAIEMSERELLAGVLKLALSLAGLLILLALIVSLIVGDGQQLFVDVLLVSVAFGFLTNGVLAVLKIIDWFENRAKRDG